jgi:hypothetical protein
MRLRLLPAPPDAPLRPTVAWLFPSTDTAAIVRELSRQPIDLAAAGVVRLPIGILVLPAETTPLGTAARGIPFGRLVGNVLAPVDAVPNAAVGADEWVEIFPPGTTFVWHPTAGVFAVAADDQLRIADLLRLPDVDGRRWDLAVPGLAFNGRIMALGLDHSPTAAEIWGDAIGAIGVEPPSLATLPPIPGEWVWPTLKRIASRRARLAAAGVAVGLALVAAAWFVGWGAMARSASALGELLRAQPWLIILDRFVLVSLAVTLLLGVWCLLARRYKGSPPEASPGMAEDPGQGAKREALLISIPASIGTVAMLLLAWLLAAPPGSSAGEVGTPVAPLDATWLRVVGLVFCFALVVTGAVLVVRWIGKGRAKSGPAASSAGGPSPEAGPVVVIEFPVVLVCVAIVGVLAGLVTVLSTPRLLGLCLRVGLVILAMLPVIWLVARDAKPAWGDGGTAGGLAMRPVSWWRSWWPRWWPRRHKTVAARAPRAAATWRGPSRWIDAWQAALARAFESLHQREIRRLLHLLERDPDTGLRFAVPLTEDAARGIVPPAAGLAERPVDYGAPGGGRGGFIAVSAPERLALVTAYRELANREVRLGRHRRAAFIFSTLLGDDSTAARMLIDGGYFREAATLYAEKLRLPWQAAEALERGGFLSEAIEAYERLPAHEKVGDLATRLGLDERAERAFRRAVDARLATRDPLGAARLLAGKMNAVDEAIDRLVAAWPDSPQAVACVTEAFRHLAALGRHGAAREFVRRIAGDGRFHGELTKRVLGILPTIARSYPDDATRRLAADETRLVAAEALATTTKQDGLRLILGALKALEPGDRLLARDTQAYGRRRRRKPPPPAGDASCQTQGADPLILPRRTVPLPAGRWTTLAAVGGSLVVAGRIGRQVAVARLSIDGDAVEVATNQVATNQTWFAGEVDDEGAARHPCLLAVSQRLGRIVVQMPLGFAIGGRETLPATGDGGPLVVGGHPALATGKALPFVAGIAYSDASTFDLVRCRVAENREATWVRERYDAATESFLGSWPIPQGTFAGGVSPVTAFLGELAYFGSGDTVVVTCLGDISWRLRTEQAVIRLCPSTHDRRSVAVSLADGGIVIRDDFQDKATWTPFGAGLEAPHCGFLSADLVVAAADGVVEIHDISRTTGTCVTRLRDSGIDPVAIVPFGSGSPSAGFAILGACGRIFLFDVRLPRLLFQDFVMPSLPAVPIDLGNPPPL